MEATEIELIDSLLYLYILCGWIDIVFSAIFLVVIVRNWKNASSANSPSQYNMRTKYLISSILCVTSALLYGMVVVFGLNNTVIPWDYKALPLVYQEVMVFLLSLTAFAFNCSMLVSFLFRAVILYGDVGKVQAMLLNVFTAFIMVLIVLMAVFVALGGVNLGHFQDQSTGIGIIRPLEQSVAIASKFVVLPLLVLEFVFFGFVFSYKLKLLKQVATKSVRDATMPIVLKESILVLVACSAAITFWSCIALIPDDNVTLSGSLYNSVVLTCIFFMFQFNHRAFYKCCYYPSLLWLNVCCFHAKNEDDAQLLELQCGVHGEYNATKQEESEVDDETDVEQEALNPDDL